MSAETRPFSIDVPDTVLDDLRHRLRATHWPERFRCDDADEPSGQRYVDRMTGLRNAIAFESVDPRSDDAIAALTAYFDELGERFPAGFDPGDTLVADAPAMRPPAGSFVIARSGASVCACGAVLRRDDTRAEIKRMWVRPDARGIGLGRALLRRLESDALDFGYREVVLDTNDTLTEAIELYHSAGYRPIERYNDNPYAQRWFTKEPSSEFRERPGA